MASRIQSVRSYTLFTEIDEEVTQVRFGFSRKADPQHHVKEFLESIPVGELRKYHRFKVGYAGKARKAKLVESLLGAIFSRTWQGSPH